MNKLVYSVFKALAMSMIFVFVLDIGFYMFRALNLNQRMESLMVSMQMVVMENNYLPEGSYDMYEALLINIADTMNSGDTGDDRFIYGFNINYDHDADLTGTNSIVVTKSGQSVDILRKRMDTPADYGDVMVVQVEVFISYPTWSFSGSHSADNWDKDTALTSLTYTYLVPCLQYQLITN